MAEYYEDEGQYEEGTAQNRLAFLSDEKLLWPDWVLGLALGVVAACGMWFFALPGVSPLAWNDVAVAAALRPPADIAPGFWRVMVSWLFLGGIESGLLLYRIAGCICGMLTAMMGYVLVRSLVALLVRGRLRYAIRRRLVQRIASVAGAVLFICADPVWNGAMAFGPSALYTLMAVSALSLFVLFMLNGSLWASYVAMLLLGALAAESPLGLVLLALCWFSYYSALRNEALSDEVSLSDPLTGPAAKWTMSLMWGLGFAGGIAIDCWSFSRMGGLAAAAVPARAVPLMLLQCWGTQIMQAFGGLGGALALGVCAVPFTLALIMLPRAVDEDSFLPYHVGALFLFLCLIAYFQLSMLNPLWFWTWSEYATVRSEHVLSLLLLLSACTVAFALTVLGGDVCCRNRVRLASLRRAEEDSTPLPVSNPSGVSGLIMLGVAVALLLVGAVPGRVQERVRALLAVVDDFVAETVRECGSAKWVFTDGSCDAGLELAAAAKGGKLRPLCLDADASHYARSLRRRDAADAEDVSALEAGSATALRTWLRDKPERLPEMAVQRGLEMWLREGEEIPPCSGVLMRPRGMDEPSRLAGISSAEALANRLLKLLEDGDPGEYASRQLADLVGLVQWRLARMARLRAMRADRGKDGQTAKREQELADRLDERNSCLQAILEDAQRVNDHSLRQSTPREGLQIALLRADFPLAYRHAVLVLEADPADPDANFGAGMYFFEQQQYTRAETHLRRCLERIPNEPAIWNNLAVVLLKQNRLDEAEQSARKAEKLLPRSDEVRDTLKQIQNARQQKNSKKVVKK